MKMKKAAAALCAAVLSMTAVSFSAFAEDTGVKIDETNFPDETFREKYVKKFDTDENGSLSDEEIAAVKVLDCSSFDGYGSIESLEGIGNFTALTYLDCSDNQLSELDVSKNTGLIYLYCYRNKLTKLDASKHTALTELGCAYNKIAELDVSNCAALEELNCTGNQLTSLDVSDCAELKELGCSENQLTELDISNNTELTGLYCYDNKITKLDISNNPNIIKAHFDGDFIEPIEILGLDSYLLDDVLIKEYIVSGEDEIFYHMYYDKATKVLTEPEDPEPEDTEPEDTDGGIQIDATNFPDENFREYVSENCDVDGNGRLSNKEIAAVTEMECIWLNIKSLEGIEYFTALTYLDCGDNELTSLDVSKNTKLESLYCYRNSLKELDISKNTALTDLDCDFNELTTLDVSKNTKLESLYCYGNSLKELDVSKNTVLENFQCSGNQLTELDLSKNTALIQLWCYDNQLTTLDVSNNTELSCLSCYSNSITELDISKCPNIIGAYTEGDFVDASYDIEDPDILDNIYVKENNLSEIWYDRTTKVLIEPIGGVDINETNFPDANFREYISENLDINKTGSLSDYEIKQATDIYCDSCEISSLKGIEYFTALTSLGCSNNQLTELDVSKNTGLISLDCYGNKLTKLDVSKNTAIEELWCYNNQITNLDISNCASLKDLNCFGNQLTELDISGCAELSSLTCSGNKLTSLDVSKNTALVRLECADNKLTALDVSKNTELEILGCESNSLKELDLNNSTALILLSCYGNEITALDISKNTALQVAFCHNNKIAEIDISNNPYIITAYTKGKITDPSSYAGMAEGDYFFRGYQGTEPGESDKHYFISCDETTKVITGAAKPEEKPVTLTDEKTKVTVAGALDGLKLNVKPADVKDAVAAYDITLTDADNKVVQPSGKIEISIPCETKGLYVYHIKDDGTKEYIESKYVDGCYVFTVDHLSVYALMKDKPEEKPVTTPEETKPENKPTTGDTKPADDSNKPTGSAAGIAFAGIALAGAALMVSKKRK